MEGLGGFLYGAMYSTGGSSFSTVSPFSLGKNRTLKILVCVSSIGTRICTLFPWRSMLGKISGCSSTMPFL
jgi:hypothetical protein